MTLRHRSLIGTALVFAVATERRARARSASENAGKARVGLREGAWPAALGRPEAEFAPCKVGRRQSPVDIQKTEKADLPAIQFDYKPSPLRIVDNGHTIMVTYAAGSSIRVGNARYELKQFHFHRPSEARIHGQSYDMELHLVHADAAGHLAVVAVLLEHGKESPLVRELWKDIPKEKKRKRCSKPFRSTWPNCCLAIAATTRSKGRSPLRPAART